MGHIKSYIISIRVYLDTCTGCYKNIITINNLPEGPLRKLVGKLQMPQLSPFKTQSSCGYNKDCALALYSVNECDNDCRGCIMNESNIPELFSFLMSTGYTIDTSLTKLLNKSEIKINDDKVLCFITYNA